MKILKMDIKELINKILKKDKWKINLYYNNQRIKKIYVDDEFKPLEEFYIIKVIGKKHLFGTNKPIQLIFQFKALKFTNESKKEMHIEIKIWEGVS